uniref:Alpha-catulin n=1 Tax=Romanomermis culicivorax TaxID=13658 RepID=A0A915I097_ROMCU
MAPSSQVKTEIQITTLVNHREKYSYKSKNDKTARALMKVGSAVQAAVERFVTVGESIADENPEIQPEMYDACQEARSAGASISTLSNVYTNNSPETSNGQPFDRNVLIRSARQLLSSVTRVLLLADRVVVKQILKAEDKVAYSLTRLENTHNFTEFVKIFTQFGGEMVDLAHRTGDRQQDLKSDKRRAQMHISRNVLEKFTLLLLTSSKTLLRHPDCESARQTRDGVFRHMRLALQLVGLCVCEGVVQFDTSRYFVGIGYHEDEPLDIGLQLTASVAIKQLLDTLEMVRVTGNVGVGIRERLIAGLDSVSEMTQDFTDSAYTSHNHRAQLIDYLEDSRYEMGNLLKPEEIENNDKLGTENVESTVQRLCAILKDIRKQLQVVAMEQVSEIFRTNEDQLILSSIKACSVSGDIDGVEQFIEKFREHSEHVQESVLEEGVCNHS